MKLIKKYIKSIFGKAGFKVSRNHPRDTLETAQLALAYFSKLDRQTTIVQIGACDGKQKDPIHDFLLSNIDFAAVLVEPLPSNFQLLEQTYAGLEHIRLVNAAVSDESGTGKIYSVIEEGRWKGNDWVKQFASFEKRHLFKMGIRESEIAETEVPIVTIGDLQSAHEIERIDLLVVDTEGFDDVVVNTALESDAVPLCLYFEFVHISPQRLETLFDKIKSQGYSWSFGSGNVLCVHSDLVTQWTRLPHPS